MAATLGLVDELCDNTLAKVVSFLDFRSAVRFSRASSKALKERFFFSTHDHSPSFGHVWKDTFRRHYFSPVEKGEVDYIEECRDRNALFRNLVGKKKTLRQPFNLPNRFFYFCPIMPAHERDDPGWDDPPPVDFDCNSFLLTSTGCSGEMIFLDPFDMSLTVHGSCVDNAVASDEAMMEQAMMDAASVIRQRSTLGLEDMPDEYIAGAVIDETVYRNHNVDEYHTPPKQVLLDADDYFNVNLAEYFRLTNDRHARRRDAEGLVLHEDDEVDFGYIGIDSKPILGRTGEVDGTAIGLGRFLCSLHADGMREEESSCTEIITWRRLKGEALFSDRRICRVPWDIHCLDTCPMHNRIYAVFLRGQGPLPRDSEEPQDSGPLSPVGRKTIFVYPLMPTDETDQDSLVLPRYFPKPVFKITCSDSVSHVIVDPTGTLLVGTSNGNIEIWKPESRSRARRVSILNVKASIVESAKRLRAESLRTEVPDVAMVCEEATTRQVNDHDVNESNAHDLRSIGILSMSLDESGAQLLQDHDLAEPDDTGDSQDSDSVMEPPESEDTQDWLPRLHSSAAVESFHFPSHLATDECGFVSVQHNRVEGTTLLLWKKATTNRDFQVVSQIHLPLSPRRKPCVHYDGRRIIVCGQDHIGLIILVYHVLSSLEDIDYFPTVTSNCKGDESGGVRNFNFPTPLVRFANRIRHAALGGLEEFEMLHMTCNERFLVVNTKTGNLLGGGSSPTSEGLLVIDLKEKE